MTRANQSTSHAASDRRTDADPRRDPVVAARSRSIISVLVIGLLRERRRLLLGLAIAGWLMAAMVSSLYSSIGVDFDEVLDDLPPALEGMLGDADFGTPEGFLQVELFSFVGPGLAIAAAVSAGGGSIAGSEESGRLALVVSGPVKRSQIVVAGAITTICAAVVATAGLFMGIVFGVAVADLDVPLRNIAGACIALAVLAVSIGMLSLAVGALTGHKSWAVGSGVAVAIASYAIDAFFPLSATLEPLAKISLWYPLSKSQPLVNGLGLGDAVLLGALGALCLPVSLWGFGRRDLRL